MIVIKKLHLLSNLLWMIGITVIAIVILQQFGFISFLPTTIDPYTSNSLDQIQLACTHTIAYNCIGYAFFIISVVLKICVVVYTENNSSKMYPLRITENKPNYLLMLCNIVIITFSLICLFISFVITLLAAINTNDIPL